MHKAQRENAKQNKFCPISPGPHRFIKVPLDLHSVYRSDPHYPIKLLMTAHLIRRNTKSVPWVGEEALTPTGEQDSTDHDIGPRTSKSSSPLEEPDSKILRGYYEAKGSGDLGLFHIGPMTHAKEEEVSKYEQRKSRLPGYTAEDDLVLSRPKSRKGKAPCRKRQSP